MPCFWQDVIQSVRITVFSLSRTVQVLQLRLWLGGCSSICKVVGVAAAQVTDRQLLNVRLSDMHRASAHELVYLLTMHQSTAEQSGAEQSRAGCWLTYST